MGRLVVLETPSRQKRQIGEHGFRLSRPCRYPKGRSGMVSRPPQFWQMQSRLN